MASRTNAAATSGPGPNLPSSPAIRSDSTTTTSPAGRNASAVPIADQPDSDCRYWVIRNWKDTYVPNSVIAPMSARTSAADLKMLNGTSGSELRRSISVNRTSSSATATNEKIVRSDAQPACCADTTV